MTHDIAGAARSLQASASKRQFGAGIPSKKINVCPEIACDKDAVVNRIAGTVRFNDLCRNGAKALGISNRFAWVLGSSTAAAAVSAECCSCSMTLWRVTVRSRSGMIVPFSGGALPFQFAG
jgi:hypothetical protein